MSSPKGPTRERILDAAFEALRTKGFAGASARVIAGLADVNPGLLFYYFESVEQVLLEALRRSSEERLERHREAVASVQGPAALVAALRDIYQEDRSSGHIRVVSEVVAGSVGRPDLARPVMAMLEPWVTLAEESITRALGPSLAPLADPRELALAAVTFYLGANLLTELSGDDEGVRSMLASAERAASLFEGLTP